MRSSLFITALVATVAVAGCHTGADSERTALRYPAAERGDQVDDYHGTAVADPYRWLEELDGERTRAWVEAENELSRPFLEGLAARAAIKDRLTALWDHERQGLPFKEAGLYFFTRNDGLQNQDVLYVAPAIEQLGAARVLIDPNTFSADGTVSLAGVAVSPDGAHVAYATSDGGSDWKTWRVRRIADGTDLPEVLSLIKFTPVAWTRDGSAFYYSRYPRQTGGSESEGDGSQPVAVYLHRLGTAQVDDPEVYALPEQRLRNPYPTVTDDGRYLIFTIQEGYFTNAVHVRDLGSATPASPAPVVPLLDAWDARYVFIGNDGPQLYFTTNHNAPRNRVIAVDIRQPAPKHWREVIAEAEATLEGASLVGGRLIAQYLEDAKSRVQVFATDGTPLLDVELPGIGNSGGFRGRFDDSETFYSYTSFTVPPSIYRYDVDSGASQLVFQPALDVDLDEYQTQQVFYQSKDGTRVPMFITHRRDLARDRTHPTLLTGYGGFNVSMTPRFSLTYVVWLELGGVLALPNLRGGGEYGHAWHVAGTRQNKQNVFDDFIAAAEWLIAEGYTGSTQLGIQGGSNGGLLVAAAMTQRPELFGAVLPAVGVLDMLRYHLPSANARNWNNDYGLSDDLDDFRAQYAYSPLHNLKAGTCYPPTLITTADHDDRVVPWHSYKYGAALQHAQACAHPILVRIETRAGHGAGTPTWMRIEQIADQWAFLAYALGMEVPTAPSS